MFQHFRLVENSTYLEWPLPRKLEDNNGTFVIYPVDPGFCRLITSEARLYRYLTAGRPRYFFLQSSLKELW